MSLTICGKVNDVLVMGSDGMVMNIDHATLTHKFVREDLSKIVQIGSNYIYTMNGREIPQWEAMNKTNYKKISQSVPPEFAPSVHLEELMDQANQKVHPNFQPPEEINSQYQFFIATNGYVVTARFMLGFKDFNDETPTSYRTNVYEVDFPFITGGMVRYANDEIMELILRGETPNQERTMKAMIYHLISATSKVQKGVGGKTYMGVLRQNGYSPLSATELMDVKSESLDLGARIQRKSIESDVGKIEGLMRNLIGGVVYLCDTDILARMGERRLEAFKQTQSKPYFDSAYQLLHLFEELVFNQGTPTKYGPSVVRSLMGEWALMHGEKDSAINLFNDALNKYLKATPSVDLDVVKQRSKAIIRSLKGLASIKDARGMRLLPEISNDLLQSDVLTREEIDNIRVGL